MNTARLGRPSHKSAESASKKSFLLDYNFEKWEEIISRPQNTLQIFVTNKCNKRCPECFYGARLGAGDMPMAEYRTYILEHRSDVSKIVLLGGEPTLHENLPEMVEFNAELGLKTTIYTNGTRLERLKGVLESEELSRMLSVRVGVHGLTISEKPLKGVRSVNFPVTIVYMLAKYNTEELMEAAYFAEENFNCEGFYVSSVREIDKAGSFWTDTDKTVPLPEYARITRDFVSHYRGGIKTLHIATRGVLFTQKQNFLQVKTCRFGNIMQNGDKIISPLDISVNKTSSKLTFGKQRCSRHNSCVLQKIVLKKRL